MDCENIVRFKAEYTYYTLVRLEYNFDQNIYDKSDMCSLCNIGFHTFQTCKLRREHNIFQNELKELKYKFIKQFIFLFFTENKYLCYDIINYILEYY